MGLFSLHCVYYVYSLLGFEKNSHNCVDFLLKISIMISEGEINVLTKFQFKNFKSFRDETTLSLSASKMTENSSHLVQLGNEKVLTTAAIYGANASGKSNAIEALRFMAIYVMDSFGYGGEEKEKRGRPKKWRCTPFLFDNTSKDASSTFEVHFATSESEGCKSYIYGFALDNSGVAEEWLSVKARTARAYKRVFYRNRATGELDLCGIPSNQQSNILISLENETLIVSLGAKLKIAKLKYIRDWFFDFNYANFGDPIENAMLSRIIPEGFDDDKCVQDRVVEYFSVFDPAIIGFDVETIPDDDNDTKHIRIDAIHRVAGTNDIATIPMADESAGTLKMFALYPALQDTLQTGGVLFVDELNARLHPLLVRAFIETFLNPETNPNHAQLVFTTHDAWQISDNLLRRDEIWFAEKNSDGVSKLYSLADVQDEDGAKIRKDENYEKNYLNGKYRAIPILSRFDMFTETNSKNT